MTLIPALSTIGPLDRIEAALAALADIPAAMAASIVGRESHGDDFLRITSVGPLGRAVVTRLDDKERHRSTISMVCDAHAPVLASLPAVYGPLPRPGRCVAAELGEFALRARDAMSGAVAREPGTEPPYDAAGITKAFGLLRSAIESQGLADGDGGLMIIRPAPIATGVRIEWHARNEQWEAMPAFREILTGLCIKSEEITICGTDETLGKHPLSTHPGHIIQLSRPEQMGTEFRTDPVATLRSGDGIGEGPWLMPVMPF